MKTLNIALEELTLQLAGESLDSSIILTKEHLDSETHSEFDAFAALFGTSEIFQLYNSKGGIRCSKPMVSLILGDSPYAGIVLPKCTVKLPLSTFTVVEGGSSIDTSVVLDGEPEFFGLSVMASLKQDVKGVVSSATLQKNPSSALLPSGAALYDGLTATLIAAHHQVMKANTADEYQYTVIGTSSGQYRCFSNDTSLYNQLLLNVGKPLTVKDGVLSCGSVVHGLRGTMSIKDAPEGVYKITGHRQETRTSKAKGTSWNVTIVATDKGEYSVPSGTGASIVNHFSGDNLQLVKVGESISLAMISEDNAAVKSRFKGLLSVPKAD